VSSEPLAQHALELADRALRVAEADEADVLVHAERSGLARFACSRVHQPTLIADEAVSIRVVRDGRVGTVSTNRTDDDGLREAVRRAEAAAAGAPPDHAFPGLPQPSKPPSVKGFDEETAALAPQDQAEGAWTAIEAAPELGLYGYFTSAVSATAVASTTGIAVSHAATDATVLAIAASERESGYAEATSWRAGELDPAEVAREAVEKARRTRDAEEVEPGTFRAVLEPYAFAELLWYFAATSLGALALLEGRSYFSGRLGEPLFHPSFSLADDGLDPAGFPRPFDFEGVPKQRLALVEEGVARDVVWDRRTGKRGGHDSTGHALPPAAQAAGPLPLNLSVAPGERSVEELAQAVGEGIHVTRLHYLGVVDPREGIITGMTRDGTFRIEDGRVTAPLLNLRFTTSFPALVERLLGLGREVKLTNLSDFYDERMPHAALVPAIATEALTIDGPGSSPGL